MLKLLLIGTFFFTAGPIAQASAPFSDFIHCVSRNPPAQVFMKFNADMNETNIVVLDVQPKPLLFSTPIEIVVGTPGTRLAGLIAYSATLSEDIEFSITMFHKQVIPGKWRLYDGAGAIKVKNVDIYMTCGGTGT